VTSWEVWYGEPKADSIVSLGVDRYSFHIQIQSMFPYLSISHLNIISLLFFLFLFFSFFFNSFFFYDYFLKQALSASSRWRHTRVRIWWRIE